MLLQNKVNKLRFQPSNMLVTGGAGFIGANFIRHVLNHELSIHIVNLDKLTYAGSLDNLKDLPHLERYHFIHGDIADADLVTQLLQDHRIDTIVHFAAESHVDRSISSPAAFVETNVLGTFVLLEVARKYWFEVAGYESSQCLFHHVSTDEVYGSLNPSDPLFTEQTAYFPRSPYSASKAGSDHLVNAYFHTFQVPTIISHCSNNYGPYQHEEKFIPTVINSCLNWQTIPIYGNGSNIRDWLYVEDHCQGIMLLIKQGRLGETYNMGGENEIENIVLAKHICDYMDKHFPRRESYHSLLKFVTDRPGHDFRYAIDIAKIKNELNWTPRESLQTGLEKTIEFYLHKYNSTPVKTGT